MDNEEQTPIDESNESGFKSLALIIGAIWLGIFLIAGTVYFLSGNNTSPIDSAGFSQSDDQVKKIQDQLKSDPNNLNLLMNLGHLFLDTNRPGEAIPIFEKVLSLDPNNLDSKVDIVVANMKLGRTNNQLEKLDEILKIDPTYDYALYVKANFLSTISKDYQGALDILRDLEKIVTDQDKLKTVKSSITQGEQGLNGEKVTPAISPK